MYCKCEEKVLCNKGGCDEACSKCGLVIPRICCSCLDSRRAMKDQSGRAVCCKCRLVINAPILNPSYSHEDDCRCPQQSYHNSSVILDGRVVCTYTCEVCYKSIRQIAAPERLSPPIMYCSCSPITSATRNHLGCVACDQCKLTINLPAFNPSYSVRDDCKCTVRSISYLTIPVDGGIVASCVCSGCYKYARLRICEVPTPVVGPFSPIALSTPVINNEADCECTAPLPRTDYRTVGTERESFLDVRPTRSRQSKELAIKLCVSYLDDGEIERAIALHKLDPVTSPKIGEAAARTEDEGAVDYFCDAGCTSPKMVLYYLDSIDRVRYLVEDVEVELPSLYQLEKNILLMSPDVLNYLIEKGVNFGTAAMKKAVSAGNLPLLQRLMNVKNVKPSTRLCDAAAQGDSIEMMTFLRTNNYIWDENTLNLAVIYGSVEMIQFMLKNGCGWNKYATSYAAMRSDRNVLSILVAHGCSCHVFTANAALIASKRTLNVMLQDAIGMIGIQPDMKSFDAQGHYITIRGEEVALFK